MLYSVPPLRVARLLLSSPTGSTSFNKSATFSKGISEPHLVSRYSNSGLVRPCSQAAVGRNVFGPADWPEHRLHGVGPDSFTVVPLTATRAVSPAFEIVDCLSRSDEVLYPVQNRFPIRHTQPEGLYRQLAPFHLDHRTPLFGAVVIHANHFHPEFHARNLPRSTSFANPWLASFKLKRCGSNGPYCSNR